MSLANVISSIDAEISRLQQARALLAGMDGASPKAKAPATKPGRKKHRLSAEARARIAEAQKKRWAAQKKAAK